MTRRRIELRLARSFGITCAFCRRRVGVQVRGRLPRFCSQRCRVAAWRASRRR